MEFKNCPECLSEIPLQANVCKFCGQRIEGQKCQECLSFSPEGATTCGTCGNKFKKRLKVNLARPLVITSKFIPTLFFEFNFAAQKASFSNDKIILSTPGFLGFTENKEEISWDKVAGFSHKSGVFWDNIYIETRGQTGVSIRCLDKDDSSRVKKVLQNLEK